jgi:hypothetical protein
MERTYSSFGEQEELAECEPGGWEASSSDERQQRIKGKLFQFAKSIFGQFNWPTPPLSVQGESAVVVAGNLLAPILI